MPLGGGKGFYKSITGITLGVSSADLRICGKHFISLNCVSVFVWIGLAGAPASAYGLIGHQSGSLKTLASNRN